MHSLLEKTAFSFKDGDAVAAALAMFEGAACRFSDCLRVAKHPRWGCEFTATLARRMGPLAGVRVV